MAKENQDGQEKTEDPTAQRLQKMRSEAQVPRSQELKTMALTLAGAALIFLLGQHFGLGFSEIFRDNFSLDRGDLQGDNAIYIHLSEAAQATFWMLMPFFIGMIIIAVLANTLMGGFVISKKKLKPKLSNMSPLKGVKRMFGTEGLVNLVKSILKVILIGGGATLLLNFYIGDFIHLSQLNVETAMTDMLVMIAWFTLLLSVSLVILALIDVPYQIHKFKSESKMTKQEVKDDRKQSEGSDETKRRIRQVQFETAQRRMMEEVPKADVIITNPLHFAVALRYDEDVMAAPIVVAKGADLIAHRIREIGEEHRITIVEAPMLARAVYFTTELNQPIPAGLYLAVAKLLAYVYQLEASPFEVRDDDRVRGQWQVPEDMQFDANGKKRK
jgi:flagellar biosynthetic protein FlhB